MRILVGTLHTIENEFDDCVAAIGRQTHKPVEHFVIDNLPNIEAHDALYGRFMQRADQFDLFMKVDADMVIEDDHLFEKIAARFRDDDSFDMFSVGVHDFFSDRIILGMHAFRSTVRWPKRDDSLFADRPPVANDRMKQDLGDLAHSIKHCKNPSDLQAFHFGLHKAMKVREAAEHHNPVMLAEHWQNIDLTWLNFRTRGDRPLALASLGAELALRGRFKPEHLNYSNPYAQNVLDRYDQYDANRLKPILRRLRFINRRGLPSQWYMSILRQGALRCITRRIIPLSWRATLWRRVGKLSRKTN